MAWSFLDLLLQIPYLSPSTSVRGVNQQRERERESGLGFPED